MDGIEALAELVASVSAAAGRLAVVVDQVEAMAARVEKGFALIDKIGMIFDVGADAERERLLGIPPTAQDLRRRRSRLRSVR
jgi:hypothetical protein